MTDDQIGLVELVLKIVAGTTALVLFIIGLIRYKNDQVWKRKEFVSKEIKEFLNNHEIHNCLLMLDWDTRYIELYPKNPNYEERFAKIGRKEVATALIPHGNLKEKYTRDQSIIRDNFDHFLDHLCRFEHFIQAGLIRPDDLEPYLRYWIDTIAEDLSEPLKSTFHHYIAEYGYKDVNSLFARFGRELNPALTLKEILSNLENKTTTGNLGN